MCVCTFLCVLLAQILSQQEAYDRLLEETNATERRNMEVLNHLLAPEGEEKGHESRQLRGTATVLHGPSTMGQLVKASGKGSGRVTPEEGSATLRMEHHLRGSSVLVGGVGGRREEVMRQVDQVWRGSVEMREGEEYCREEVRLTLMSV